MTSGTLADVEAAVRDAAPYLCLSTDPYSEKGWSRCSALIARPSLLLGSILSTAPGRGTSDVRVAGSLWLQSYAFRVPSVVLAAHALGLPLPTMDLDSTWVRIVRDRPGQVAVSDISVRRNPGTTALAQSIVRDHLAIMARAVSDTTGASLRVLHSNVASSIARLFVAVERPGVGHPFLAAAAPWLPLAGHWEGNAEGGQWVRDACCLWYQTSGGHYCDDCIIPLRSPPND